jgi:hypothetical protein
MLYRLSQVWRMKTRHLEVEEQAWVQSHLAPAQLALFLAQQPGDQVHAYTVARTLADQQYPTNPVIIAALLHDCGKAPGISLFYRTLVVLLKKTAPHLLYRLRPTETGWLAPLARAWYHPELGAALAEAVNCSPDVVTIIRYHQRRSGAPPGELKTWIKALRKVDDMN